MRYSRSPSSASEGRAPIEQRGIRLDPRAMFSRADDNVLGKSLKLSCCLFSRVPLTHLRRQAAHGVIPVTCHVNVINYRVAIKGRLSAITAAGRMIYQRRGN